MSARQIVYGEEARRAILDGVSVLSRAVKATLGPKGRNAMLDKTWGAPTVTKDGVTVAKEIDLKHSFENMGAQMVKQVASKTADVAGDGTTTATVLAEAIYREGLRNVTAGANPMALKRGIDKAVTVVVDELTRMSRQVKSDTELLKSVATISANNDATIGTTIAEAMQKVGNDGTITVEEAKGIETTLEVVEGMQFDKGYLSPYFVTDGEAMEVDLEDAYVLIHEKKIAAVQDLLPLLEKIAKAGRPLLVVAEDIGSEVLAALVVNRLRGTIKACAVKAPAFGDRRKDLLQDIAVLTGGLAVTEDLGRNLETLELSELGQAKRIVVDKDTTTFIEGGGSSEDIRARIQLIKRSIKETTSTYDREKLEERLAKLAGGVAVIHVGAATEIEMKEKKARVDDALHAVRAAVEEGIVPGGGVALLRCQSETLKLAGELTGDEATGARIVSRALEEPLRQIAINAGEEGSMVVQKVKTGKNGYGFNAENGQYEDLMKADIIDPTKVARAALQNAASVAGLLLTTEALVAELPEKKRGNGAPNYPSSEDF